MFSKPASECGRVIRQDLLQSRPGKAIDGLQTVADGGRQVAQPVEFLAAALAGQLSCTNQLQRMEFLGRYQREPGQYARIDTITLGMFPVVAAQVSHLLAVDQIHLHALSLAEHRHREPGHAGRLHHHNQGFICWSSLSDALE